MAIIFIVVKEYVRVRKDDVSVFFLLLRDYLLDSLCDPQSENDPEDATWSGERLKRGWVSGKKCFEECTDRRGC